MQNDPDMRESAHNALIPGAKIAGASGIGEDDDKDQLGMRLRCISADLRQQILR